MLADQLKALRLVQQPEILIKSDTAMITRSSTNLLASSSDQSRDRQTLRSSPRLTTPKPGKSLMLMLIVDGFPICGSREPHHGTSMPSRAVHPICSSSARSLMYQAFAHQIRRRLPRAGDKWHLTRSPSCLVLTTDSLKD